MTGTIFDVKRFAVHDGGGLRSTLFLKGCPLRCPWCQNPEGIDPQPALWHSPTLCMRCGGCVGACPAGALTLSDRVHIDHGRCTLCSGCIDACPAAAMEFSGRTVTAREAADMLLRDKVFFGHGGGVTLSGGEALLQWEFSREVLALCKADGADTAIETSLFAPRQAVESMLPVTDHFLVDIKYLDAGTHRKVIGADNGQILDNYRFLLQKGADILVRTPLIPGFTAAEDNIRAIARFIHGLDSGVRYELLNFNPLCRSKYAALEREYPVSGGVLPREEIDRFYAILEQEGIQQIIKE